MPIVSPDQVNRQKQDLEDAARLAQHRASGWNMGDAKREQSDSL